MIRGFVSCTYAVTVSRNEPPGGDGCSPAGVAGSPAPTASLRDTVARATSADQIRTESATWSTTAQGRSREKTFSAPDAIWATNRPSVSVESLTTSADRSVMVRARIATQSTSTATAAARTRCTNMAVAAPPSAGTSRPSMSGQSVKASPAEVARTYVPTSSRAPVAPTTTNVSRANAGSSPVARLDPPFGRSTRNEFTATTITSATNARATAKWAVTHQGFNSVRTTTPPRTAWPRTSGIAASAGHTIDRTARYRLHAAAAVATTNTVTTNTRDRCENSMKEWMPPEGNNLPGSQVGQVEQPSPEPVPRTSPPTANSAIVAVAVATASFWKRFIRWRVMAG